MNQPSFHPLGQAPNRWWVNQTQADLSRPSPPSQLIEVVTETKQLRLDLNRSACLVIDMQNDFCHSAGWLASIGVDITPARTPIAPLQQILPPLRQLGVPILWVNWGNRPDLLNISPALRHVYNPTGMGIGLADSLPSSGAPVLTKGSWGAAVVEELVVDPLDIWVDKYRMSGFWDTPLDSILRNLGKTTLFFAGVNIDQCVMTTLQDANFLGYDCLLLKDCSATTSPDYCRQATLYNVNQCFGFVLRSLGLLEALPGIV